MTTTLFQRDPTIPRLCGWAITYALRRWLALGGVLSSLLLRVGLDMLKPWPMVFLVDYVLHGKTMPSALRAMVEHLPGSGGAQTMIGWTVAATVLIFVMSWVVGLVETYASISLSQRMTYDLAGDLFAKLQQLSLHFHARKSVGDNLRRVTSDCTCVSVIVKDALLPVLASVVSLCATFLILWRLNATLAALSLVLVPYMMLVFWRYARPMMETSYAQQEAEGRIYEVTEQVFSAVPVVQAFGREELNDRWFARTTGNIVGATLTVTNVQVQFKILMGAATAAGTALILWLGAQKAMSDPEHLVGPIILFLSYIGLLYAPLEAIMYTSSTIQGAAGSARRVWEVLGAENQVAEKPGAVALKTPRGHIQIQDVTYGYEQDRPVLRHVSLDVPAGQTVALVGATGAGKSTLVGLVPRFFDPWEGTVLLDGQDIRDVQVKTLRRNIALVLQEPFLFPLSVAENIAYGCPAATMEQIEAIARAAHAHDFIMRLPEGYQTVLGERGATLSGGERQRLSIARALLKDAPILIFDEPTSALDAETEQALMQALERLTRDRTTFIIAHRLSTVRKADRIVVLKDGAIMESGTHDELLARRGQYAHFHQLQSGQAGERGQAAHPPSTH